MEQRKLEIIPIFDVTPRKFVLVLAGLGFETVEGLRDHVTMLPKGTTIVLDPGCSRLGGEPLLEDEAQLASFKAWCEKHGTKLKVIPSG